MKKTVRPEKNSPSHFSFAGMQGTPLRPGEQRYIDPKIKFLASHLKDLGYRTNLVGKWHLGHYDRTITPLGRGFDFFQGYFSGFCGYFDYMLQDDKTVNRTAPKTRTISPTIVYRSRPVTICTSRTPPIGKATERTRRTCSPAPPSGSSRTTTRTSRCSCTYRTSPGTRVKPARNWKPSIRKARTIGSHTSTNRNGDNTPVRRSGTFPKPFTQFRTFPEIIRELDVSTGRVFRALGERKMLQNSIVVWFSDNGGQTQDPVWGYANYGSNWPLRGQKLSLMEGGVRTIGALWSPLLAKKNYVNNNTMHVTDWFPTLYAAAGGSVKDLGDIDGVNQWPVLAGRDARGVKREAILLNIDEVQKYDAIMTGDGRWKLVNRTYTSKSDRNPSGCSLV